MAPLSTERIPTTRASWWIPGLLALLVGCSPTLDWRDWRPAGSGLSLNMPCKPTPQSRKVLLAGQTVLLSLHACRAGDQTWALAYADIGDPTKLGLALAELRESAAANLGATSRQVMAPLAVPGATPHPESGRWGLVGKLPDGVAVREEVAVFVLGTHVYQATVLGPALPAEAVAMFFDSLRVAR